MDEPLAQERFGRLNAAMLATPFADPAWQRDTSTIALALALSTVSTEASDRAEFSYPL